MKKSVIILAAILVFNLIFSVQAQETQENTTLPSGSDIVVENENLVLKVESETGKLSVYDKRYPDTVWQSMPEDLEEQKIVDEKILSELKSQIIVEYQDTLKQDQRINSYTDCVLLNQVQYEKIQNGIRASYLFGKKEDRRQMPLIITEELFDEFVSKITNKRTAERAKNLYKLLDINEIKESDKADIEKKYPLVKKSRLYELNTNSSARMLTEVEKEFIAQGFSFDKIDAEYEKIGYESKVVENANVSMKVEYLIDGDFTAEIVKDSISIAENYSIKNIELLPNFCCAGEKDSGYIFVPDGSGAIIELNKDGVDRTYRKGLYGEDKGRLDTLTKSYEKPLYMPIFAIAKGNAAVFAIIENGAAAADICADLPLGAQRYNRVYPSFEVTPNDYIKYTLQLTAGVNFYSKLKPQISIKVRYKLLFDTEANYNGMAKVYREYLKLDTDKTLKTGLLLTVPGAVAKQSSFLGISYEKIISVTDYKKTAEILNTLNSNGIQNIDVRYIGWTNDGINHGILSRSKVSNKLGGKKALASLKDAVNAQNGTLFLDADISYAYKDKFFDGFSAKKDTIKYANKQIVTSGLYEINSGVALQNDFYKKYIVSPLKKVAFFEKFLKKNSFDGYGISLGSIGSELVTDFNTKKPLTRIDSFDADFDILTKSNEASQNVMTEGAIVPYAMQSDTIVSVPLSSSNLNIESYSIPFYAMVFHASKEYYCEPINLSNSSEDLLLQAVESGASLHFYLTGITNKKLEKTIISGNFSSYYEDWTEKISSTYAQIKELYADIQNSPIKSYERPQANVSAVSYENGNKIIVNYNSYSVFVDSQEIKAKSFIKTEAVK